MTTTTPHSPPDPKMRSSKVHGRLAMAPIGLVRRFPVVCYFALAYALSAALPHAFDPRSLAVVGRGS
jgi:hypothetical protein